MLDIPPLDPGIEFAVSSRGMSKGVAQTVAPQLVVRPHVRSGPVQLVAQWKNLTSSVADGEASLSISTSPAIGKVQFDLGLSYKLLTGVRESTDRDSLELSASAEHTAGEFGLRLAAFYSPNDLGSGKRSLYVEGGPSMALNKLTRVFGAIGRRERVGGDDYWAFNAGVQRTLFKGTIVDLKWHGTDRSDLGSPYKSRVVISTRMGL